MALGLPGAIGTMAIEVVPDTAGFGPKLQGALGSAVPGSLALAGALGGVAAGIGAVGLKAIMAGGQLEQSKVAFATLLGSAEAADAFVRDLWDFAAKTPFDVPGLQNAAQLMLAMGFNADEVIPKMGIIGDAVSALGGGSVEIERVVRGLGQMQAKGKITAEEMMQLTEVGIPAWQMLADALGVDVATAMDMVTKGTVDVEQGIEGILAGMEETFGGGMEAQSKTMLGIWSNFKDTIFQGLAGLGTALIDTFDLKTKLAGAVEWLGQFKDTLIALMETFAAEGLQGVLEQIFPPWLADNLGLIVGALVGALIPAVLALAGAFIAAALPLVPFLLAGAAVVALAKAMGISFSDVIAFFQQKVVPGFVAFRDTVVANIRLLVDTVRQLWQTHGAAVMQVVSGLWQVVSGIFQGGFNVIAGLVRFFVALFRGDWGAMRDAVVQIGQGLWTLVTGIFQGGANIVMGIGRIVRDAVKDRFRELVDGVKERLDDLLAWLAGLPGAILAALGSLGSLLYSAGSDLLQGLIDGAKAKVLAVARAIRDAVTSAIGTAKRWLGFGSPPRFMVETGVEMAEGVAQGLLGTRDAIARAAAAALAAARPQVPGPGPFGAGGVAVTGAGGYSHANIYVEVDRHTLIRLIGQPLVDELRVRTGKRQ